MGIPRSDWTDDGPTAASVHIDPTGVRGLDAVLGGGLPRGALMIVNGPPGSGKTILASPIAFAAAHAGRRAALFTLLSEGPIKLIEHLSSLRFFDPDLARETAQVISLQGLLEKGLEGTTEELIATAQQMRGGVLVLDGFSGLRQSQFELQASYRFLYRMGGALGHCASPPS
jgi:circadian clock protein KaiC